MMSFVTNLSADIEKSIRQLEAGEKNVLKRSLAASHLLGEAFDRLKKFIVNYQFKDEKEEIQFFKEIKPRLFRHLIYYRKLYNIEMNRPVAGTEEQSTYLYHQLDAIQDYIDKRKDFYRYYRSGSSHLDAYYFVRGKTNIEQYMETFYYERDAQFSTNCDFKVTLLLANELLLAYLMAELSRLENLKLPLTGLPSPVRKSPWTGKKTDLIELIYAIDSEGSCANVPLTQLTGSLEFVFDIDLGGNLSRSFSDMRIRNNPTPYLDRLHEAAVKRMGRIKQAKKG